ncbi:hypothetical protein [Mesorhizobium sp. 8]|uniref:hypothetical protein n=1 Tax=Mesorhizobium sp. 8 TaxID=2584466 RepID=UPI001124219F|nr:hypothetical protein [Mesorhizobium sp. 8]QDB99674.1 hypothetical protein FGU64_04225 [Mesorhizobium sp. 8]
MRKLQVIIVPFHLRKGVLKPAGHEPGWTARQAERRAKELSDRYAGVGVYGVWVDDLTLDASDLHQLAAVGDVPDLAALLAVA